MLKIVAWKCRRSAKMYGDPPTKSELKHNEIEEEKVINAS